MVSAVSRKWADMMWAGEKPIKFMPCPIDSGRWSLVFFRESGTGGMCKMVALLADEADMEGPWGHLFHAKWGMVPDTRANGYMMRFLWRVDPFRCRQAVMSAIPQAIKGETVQAARNSFKSRKMIVDTSDPQWMLPSVCCFRFAYMWLCILCVCVYVCMCVVFVLHVDMRVPVSDPT